jgi:hypothetical protein
MNTNTTPTRVIMYSILAGEPGEPTPIAEFRYHPDTGVTFTEINPQWATVARRIYENGAKSPNQPGLIPRTNPEEFMRTLLEPTTTTYYGFIDKSNNNT